MVQSLNFNLTETANILRDTVRDFAKTHIAPKAAHIDQSNQFPRELWPRIGQLGLLGITVEEKYGGSDIGYLGHIIAMEEISCASASVGLSYGAHSNLCVNQIHRHGSHEQKLRFLPKLIQGKYVGALAMSETGAGSDVLSMSLHAKQQGDHFILNGSKMWITNGGEADVVIVYAQTHSGSSTHSITAFLVEKNTPGFSAGEKLDKLGMRGSNTYPLFFDNCAIPTANVLGNVGEGIKILMSGLDYERAILAARPLGIMQAFLDLAIPYLHERQQFKQRIGDFQLMQGKLADMYVTLSASRAYVYAVGQALDRGNGERKMRKEAAGAILFAAEHATRLALDTIQCLGGNGYTNDYPAGRLLRDAKLYEIGAGTSEIRRWLIGRELMHESGD